MSHSRFLTQHESKIGSTLFTWTPKAMPSTMSWSCLIPGLLTTSWLLIPWNFLVRKNWSVRFSCDHLYDNSSKPRRQKWLEPEDDAFPNCITSSRALLYFSCRQKVSCFWFSNLISRANTEKPGHPPKKPNAEIEKKKTSSSKQPKNWEIIRFYIPSLKLTVRPWK